MYCIYITRGTHQHAITSPNILTACWAANRLRVICERGTQIRVWDARNKEFI